MSKIIDLEREFFKVARDLDHKYKTKREFLKKIKQLSEEWIDNKFRFRINGLKDK